MSVKLIYSDIAIGADTDAEVTTSAYEDFSTPETIPFGVSAGAVATCELNAWGLSPEYRVRGEQPFAFWSVEQSGTTGTFETPPTIRLAFTKQYTSSGLTLRFSPDTNDYCSQITVVWSQNGVEKERGVFYPSTPLYALENAVEAFDELTIYFDKTHLPNRRVKLEYIGIGIVREFTGKELTSAKFIHEIDYVSSALPMNVVDASFHSGTNAEFVFQRKQPVKAYDDNDLIGVYYIDKGERTSSQNYSISCHDAIGILDRDKYGGGLWLEQTPIETLIDDVIGGLFEYELDTALQGKTLKGYIPPGKRREALRHIAFALGAVVDTTGSRKIKIFLPAMGDGTVIPPEETYQGGKVSTSDIVTKVHLIAYDIYEGEKETDSDEGFEFRGNPYGAIAYQITAENPNVSASTFPNAVTYDGCWLINGDNVQERADALLAYHMRRNVYSTKHILKGQALGDRANVTMPWGDTANANVLKMTISVSGIVASDTEFLLD